MPRGTLQEDTGLLAIEQRQLVLRRAGGGTWRLDAPRRVWKLAGRQVRISGIRAGFDLLDVTEAVVLGAAPLADTSDTAAAEPAPRG